MNVRGCLEVITLWLSVTRSWQRPAHRRAGKLFGDGPYLLALMTPRGILGQKRLGPQQRQPASLLDALICCGTD